MEKRSLLAILLSIAVFIIWFQLVPPPVPQKTENKNLTKNNELTQKEEQKNISNPQKLSSSFKVSPAQKNLKEKEIKIENDTYSTTFSNKGAIISSIIYKERNIELVVNKSIYNATGVLNFPIHFSDEEFIEGNSLDETLWSHKLNDAKSISFYTNLIIDNSPLLIEKKYTFPDKGHHFKVEHKLINNSNKNIRLKNDKIIISSSDLIGPELDFDNTYNKITGSIYSINGDFKTEGKGGGIGMTLGFNSAYEAGPIKKDDGNIDWFGITGRYFLIAMIPENITSSNMISDNRTNTGFRTGINIPIKGISPKSEINNSFKIYLGEKDKDKLVAVDQRIKDASDVSLIIQPIRELVLWCLLTMNKLFGNLGWSLVIFSLLTKIIFMPLTLKSTESMKKMQELSPELNKLKAKYKDKPDVMQKEMMKMYRDNKVNPMGGCFPMLLQMPFFFALYSALINSIDLWNAPFILWMQDLSMPDTIAQIAGVNLNILPLLMTLTAFFQQKMTTVDTGQQQKMMMYMMPFIFLFIFWSMPSGLVLYWALQNTFQILHQVYVTKFSKKKES